MNPEELASRRGRGRTGHATLAGGRGIDIAACYRDIRLITLKHFHVPGVPPDDLVQEVCLGIDQRNRLPGSAFDPARAAFSTYVFLVARNVAARIADKLQRESRFVRDLKTQGFDYANREIATPRRRGLLFGVRLPNEYDDYSITPRQSKRSAEAAAKYAQAIAMIEGGATQTEAAARSGVVRIALRGYLMRNRPDLCPGKGRAHSTARESKTRKKNTP